VQSETTLYTILGLRSAPRVRLGTVLVTGAASGLGAAVAAAVAEQDGTPVGLDVAEPAAGLDRELVDLADGAAAEAAVQRVAERHGGIDAVVTAAGIDACGRLEEVPRETWERVGAVNLLGTAAVVRAALSPRRSGYGR
jgi:NAD(P)-dependent dehydrogenase (short-subunit alcohol dehydrogenase family)